MTDGTVTWDYTYNPDGLRLSRSNDTTTYNYVYNGSQLTAMTVGANTLYFSYDAAGTPMSVKYGDEEYYYTSNIQGDVIGIVNDQGQTVVTYAYDAWGRPLSCTGSMASTLGTINPLRYRGYVYDQESGLYYLQSRYYDPNLGRFINADGLISTGQGLLGNNMFAYCGNNPVMFADPLGQAGKLITMFRNAIRRALSDVYSNPNALPYISEAEAADAFAEEVLAASLYISHEFGAYIYKKEIDGVATYGYSTPEGAYPHQGPGVGPAPEIPYEVVAYIHTHPNRPEFTLSDTNIADMHKYNAYLVISDCSMLKYSWQTKSTEFLFKVYPKPLTTEQKSILVAEYRDKWYGHLDDGCEFDCSTKQWPMS